MSVPIEACVAPGCTAIRYPEGDWEPCRNRTSLMRKDHDSPASEWILTLCDIHRKEFEVNADLDSLQ